MPLLLLPFGWDGGGGRSKRTFSFLQGWMGYRYSGRWDSRRIALHPVHTYHPRVPISPVLAPIPAERRLTSVSNNFIVALTGFLTSSPCLSSCQLQGVVGCWRCHSVCVYACVCMCVCVYVCDMHVLQTKFKESTVIASKIH